MSKEIKKLEKTNFELLALLENEENDLDCNMEGVEPALLPIKIIHKAQMFEYDDIKAEGIDGIVVDSHLVNACWAKSFGETGAGTPPDCCSNDGISPADYIEAPFSVSCATCDLNSKKAKSSEDDKRCNNMRRIYLLLNGNVLPHLLTIPRSSLWAWGEYMTKISNRKRKYWVVKTIFKLDKAVNPKGIEYSKLSLSYKEDIGSVEEFNKIKELRQHIEKHLKNEKVTLDEV